MALAIETFFFVVEGRLAPNLPPTTQGANPNRRDVKDMKYYDLLNVPSDASQ